MRILVFIFCCSIAVVTSAQQPDSLLVLPEVEIVSSQSSSLKPDSVWYRHQVSADYADLVRYSGKGDITSYGPPGSASQLRIRGASSDHTLVTWNGFSINSPSLGTCDVSLIPLFFFRDALLSNNGTFTSPAIGGNIDLLKDPQDAPDELNFLAEYNSLNNSWIGMRWRKSMRKWSTQTRIFTAHNQNNFTYSDQYYPGGREVEQNHNDGKSMGWMQDLSLQTGSTSSLNFALWYQRRYADLPATMGTNPSSLSSQEDQFARSTLDWTIQKSKWSWKTAVAFFADRQVYQQWTADDNAMVIDSRMSSKQWSAYSKASVQLGKKIVAGLNLNLNIPMMYSGNFNNGKGSVTDFTIGNFVTWSPAKTIVSARSWIVNRDNESFPSAEVTIDQPLLKTRQWNLYFLGGVGYLYRLPDMNELYWQPGGNPDLHPELAKNLTGGLRFLKPSGALKIKNVFNVFGGIISDWIQWVPGINNGWWSPVNYKLVKRYGLENELQFEFGKKTRSIFSLNYHLTFAKGVNQQEWDDAASFDLAYIPRNRVGCNWILKRGKYSAIVSVNYMSSRSTNESGIDNYDLPPYTLCDLSLCRVWEMKYFNPEITVGIKNIANTQYESVRSYAMPGRTLRISIAVPVNGVKNNKTTMK